MRSPPVRITLKLVRQLHGSAGPRQPVRTLRRPPGCLSRRRRFATSSPFLLSSPTSNDRGTEDAKKKQPSEAPGDEQQHDRSAGASPGKRKPTRAATTKNSLRRVAIIAQQPKREAGAGAGVEKATSPSSPSNLVSATCLAEAFDMPAVLDMLSSHGFAIDPDGTGFDDGEVVHARSVNGGDIFVFPSGTVVTWALPADVVTTQLLRAADEPLPPHLREAEDLDFVTDTTRDTSTLSRGETVVLGTRREHKEGDPLDTTLAKIAFSSGLARSTKLAVLEAALTSYFESTRSIPALLMGGGLKGGDSKGLREFGGLGGLSVSRRFILQKTGELLGLRARLNHYSELTDNLPDIFWDSRSELGLEGYYDQVGRALDVNVRIRALNQKMDYAQEIATVLREMSSEQHGTRLEWIIIVLIFVEVVFELRRIVMEYTEETPR